MSVPSLRRRPGPLPVERPAQLRALVSPVRQEILDVLSAAGPCPIAELADRLGRAPDSLYFHVRVLLKVGLVAEHARRKVGRHVFVVYDLAGRPMWIDRSKAKREHLRGIVGGILRLAARDYARSLGAPTAVMTGAGRNHTGVRVRGWLDTAQLARANKLLETLGDLVSSGRPGPGRQPIALAWVLAPVPSRPGANARRSSRAAHRARGAKGAKASARPETGARE